MNTPRTGSVDRNTKETKIRASLKLDGEGAATVSTGLGFLDHMITALAKHSGMDVSLHCDGDLHVDDHHTAEDCALALGACLDEALGDRSGIRRFGSAYAPLDESLARAVIDLSGRAHASVTCGFRRPSIGDIATENLTHFFVSLAAASRATIHIDVLRGQNDHHQIEAAFKALALAMRDAVSPGSGGIPSTKGVI